MQHYPAISHRSTSRKSPSQLHRPLRGWVIALLSLYSALSQAAEWKHLESTHYDVYANIREDTARSLIERLELMHWFTRRMIGLGPELAAASPMRRTEVYLSRAPVGENGDLVGSVVFGDPGCLVIKGLPATGGPGDSRNELHLAAETAAIQIMIEQAPMAFPQRWYAVGFARYIAANVQVNGEFFAGAVHGSSRSYLSRQLMPYEAVLRLQPDARFLTELERAQFAAQSWWLFHELQSTPEGQQQILDYQVRMAESQESVAAFEAATGRKMADWQERLWRAWQGGSVTMQRIKAELLPRIDIRSTALDPQAAHYLHLRDKLSCSGTDGAGDKGLEQRKRLHAAVADAGPPGAMLALDLARADLRADDLDAAQTRLQALVQATPDAGEAWWLLAHALRRQAERKDRPMVDEARRALLDRAVEYLDQALRLRPGLSPAMFEKARVLTALGRPAEARSAVGAARKLRPWSPWPYARLEAELALQAGDRQAAVDALEMHAYQTWWPDQAKTARTLIDGAVAGKPATELLGLLKPEPPAGASR